VAGAAAGAPGGDIQVDYSHDPILLKAKALVKAADADAEAAALASQRRT
jgi:hypothetical protein